VQTSPDSSKVVSILHDKVIHTRTVDIPLAPFPSSSSLCILFFSLMFCPILERLARRTEVDQLEDKAHQQLRAAQALLSREREQREQAEQVVREEMAEEMAAANRAAIDALDRADEVTARCRSLESKVPTS
jgi:flagellar biosynthesis component FlhA